MSMFSIETAQLQMKPFILMISNELCSHSQKYLHILPIAFNLPDTVALQIYNGSITLSHVNYNG